jgi:DNA replication protein DnaC
MEELRALASKLGFHGIARHWDEYSKLSWVAELLIMEQKEKEVRNLDARLKEAKIGSFKPMAEFDWDWPASIDRAQIEELFTLDFVTEPLNIALIGNEGLGKTMIMQNLAYEAAKRGYRAMFVKASKMLNELIESDGKKTRQATLNRLCKIDVLCIDEIGYMNYDNRYADLLYEVIAERYSRKSTIISTNKEFNLWSEIFPTAACVVTLVDKIVHKSEIVVVKGKSYRLHEAKLREEQKSKLRKSKVSKGAKK